MLKIFLQIHRELRNLDLPIDLNQSIVRNGRSQWPRHIRHELSLPAQTWDSGFESYLRQECPCAFILCLCCPVCRWRPCDGLIPQQRAVEP
jgi:hypothetical protein